MPCGFIHLPYLPEQVAGIVASTTADPRIDLEQRADVASMSLDTMVRAVECAVEVALDAPARALA